MRIGDEVYVHGYVDEMREDVVIIRNDGGYFGTMYHEVFDYEEDERGYGTMNEADRKTEPQTDCATCRHSDTWEAECRDCDNYSNYEPRKENPQADMREREAGQ